MDVINLGIDGIYLLVCLVVASKLREYLGEKRGGAYNKYIPEFKAEVGRSCTCDANRELRLYVL